jgi:murein DD-endopeptidase MepM/ murein hydrolase activator NlpD
VVAAGLVTIGDRVTSAARTAVLGASEEPVQEGLTSYLRPSVVLATVPGILVRHQEEALAAGIAEPEPSPLVKEEATPTPEADPEPVIQAQPAYFVYTVQSGDTVGSIAASFGIDSDYILWNNPTVDDPDFLIIGEHLLVPSVNGIVYDVRLGDTLSGVAGYYQIDVQSVLAFVPNGLESPDTLIDGSVLVLPGAVLPPPPIPAAVEIVDGTAPVADAPAEPIEVPEAVPAPSSGYVWPWYGGITGVFGEARGAGWHRGVDIDGFGSYGAAVVAAASGQVILASWQDYGLGYNVVIRHDDGSETTYAHFSDIWVVEGQWVSQGEAVGALGCTGYCTGTHLHFELHIGGPVDPLGYLP